MNMYKKIEYKFAEDLIKSLGVLTLALIYLPLGYAYANDNYYGLIRPVFFK